MKDKESSFQIYEQEYGLCFCNFFKNVNLEKMAEETLDTVVAEAELTAGATFAGITQFVPVYVLVCFSSSLGFSFHTLSVRKNNISFRHLKTPIRLCICSGTYKPKKGRFLGARKHQNVREILYAVWC